jgi:glycosyltransferase involved in cell wall biosynthesis
MIDVIVYDDGLPISVIIPTTKDKLRKDFFENYVFPLIDANRPMEIIINDDLGGAPKKRNDGFKKSTQPFVFFCDNDILLPKNHLEKLLDVLNKNPDKAFAYSGYVAIVLDTINHPIKTNFMIPTMPYSVERLKQANFISTMSLIRRELFPMFDENLKRLQDWDIYLTMLKNGNKGIAV